MATAPTSKKPAPKAAPNKTLSAKAVAKPVLVHSDTAMDAAMDADDGDAALVKAGAVLRFRDLIEAVAAATGGKKKGMKEIIEATLTTMGDALERGEMLNLPAFGKARVARAVGADGAGAMTVKIRRPTATPGKARAAKEGIAAPDEQD